MNQPHTALLHYTAPPVVGGVEAVIQAQARAFLHAGYPVSVITGRGDASVLPPEAGFNLIPELDSRHPAISDIHSALEQGGAPPGFDEMVAQLQRDLSPVLARFDAVIIHNIFTKHFNLPLTAALHNLLDQGILRRCIAWCHDFSWTSPNSRPKLHAGHPWDLLRTYRSDVIYVVVSEERQQVLADLFNCPPERIRVIYNGVDPETLLGLSPAGRALIQRLGLLESALVLLMPVRVTRAKNIEYALRVAAALKTRGCRAKLIVTGPPDPHDAQRMRYFQSLQGLRRELNVEQEARFVFEAGPDPAQPFYIDEQVVAELFRASDVMFMPSHREGFGMPVLEAGLIGRPVVCTDVPAAREIGGADVTLFDAAEDPARLADRLLEWAEHDRLHRLRRRVQQNYTWQAIFHRDIEPLLRTDGSIG
ncbi:MAG TPA: glycosyltransferase family 4 protein [Anaerolineae bacterium]|nr:glycosyltransferase family 4 protein [Anaerolineae bacterium]